MADESGINTDGYFAIAGYIAEDAEWRELDQRWCEALRKHGAPYLHMKEFSGSRDAYAGWTESQRRSLMGDLLRALAPCRLEAFGAVMSVADFQNQSDDQREALIGPYVMCWQEAVLAAGINKYGGTFPGEKIDFVYSRQDDFASKMRSLWKFSKGYRDFMGHLAFEDMRHMPGLQAADLLVYELRHMYHLRETRPELPLRFPYRMLMMHQDVVDAQRLKYLPDWFVVAQANGIIEPMMDIMTSDMHTYGPMYEQQYPPLIDPLRNLPDDPTLGKIGTTDDAGMGAVWESSQSAAPARRLHGIAEPPVHER